MLLTVLKSEIKPSTPASFHNFQTPKVVIGLISNNFHEFWWFLDCRHPYTEQGKNTHKTQHKCTEKPILRHTYEEGPIVRTKPMYLTPAPTYQRRGPTHQSPYKSRWAKVAKGGRQNLDRFPTPSASEGRLPPPSQCRLSVFPCFSHPGTDLFTLSKELPHTVSIHSQFHSFHHIHKEKE